MRASPRWGPFQWGPPPTRRSSLPAGLLLLTAVVVVFLFGPRVSPAAGRVWADLQTGHFPPSFQLPKVALPKLSRPLVPRRPVSSGRPLLVAGAPTAVAYARGQVGKPYVWGANGPGGFDCSGLAWRAWQAALGWGDLTAAGQYVWLQQRGATSDLGGLQPGDLVFYDPGAIHHVAIVTGAGVMVEAPGQGAPIRQVPIRGGYLAARPGLAGR